MEIDLENEREDSKKKNLGGKNKLTTKDGIDGGEVRTDGNSYHSRCKAKEFVDDIPADLSTKYSNISNKGERWERRRRAKKKRTAYGGTAGVVSDEEDEDGDEEVVVVVVVPLIPVPFLASVFSVVVGIDFRCNIESDCCCG